MTRARRAKLCLIFRVVFAILYVFALVALFAGTFGVLGSERDPLAGIFLIPLGLPWNLLIWWLPDAALVWSGVLAPALNLLLIWWFCRRFNRE